MEFIMYPSGDEVKICNLPLFVFALYLALYLFSSYYFNNNWINTMDMLNKDIQIGFLK